MVDIKRRDRGMVLFVLVTMNVPVLTTSAFGIQTPQKVPATHERQCVSTGEIPPGAGRTITVAWKHPFATGNYEIIGSVSETGDSLSAIELAHVVMPSTPTTAAAVVFNRNANAAQSGTLCLDARTE